MANKRAKVKEYSRNVAASLGYSAKKFVADELPTIDKFVTNNQDFYNRTYELFKEKRAGINRSSGILTDNILTQNVKEIKNNAISDLKSGKFFNKEREDASGDEFMSSFLGDLDMDMDLSYDGDDDVSVSSGSSAISTAIGKSNAVTAEYIAGTLDANHQVSTTMSLSHHMETMNTMNNLVKVNSGIHENTRMLVDQLNRTNQYYDESLSALNEIRGIQKEALEMQRNLYKEDSSSYSSDGRVTSEDVFDFSGFNFESYIKFVKQNINDKSGGVGDLVNTMGGPEAMLKMMTASPLGFVSDMMVKGLLPQAAKSMMKDLDKSMSGLFAALSMKFNQFAKESNNDFLTNMLDIFGVTTPTKTKIKTDAYNKGAIPFDGITKKSIVEVIPTYLASIESALTGNPKRYFDYQSGKFKSKTAIEKDFKERRQRSYGMDMFDTRSGMEKNLTALLGRKRAEQFMKGDYNNFEEFLISNEYFFNPNKDRNYNEMNLKGLKLDGGQKALDVLVAAFKEMSTGTQIHSNKDIQAARRSQARFFDAENKALQDTGLSIAYNDFDKDTPIDSKGKVDIKKLNNGMTSVSLLDDIKTILLNGIIVYNNGKGGIPTGWKKKRLDMLKERDTSVDSETANPDIAVDPLATLGDKDINAYREAIRNSLEQDDNSGSSGGWLSSVFGGDTPLARLAGKYSNNPIIQAPIVALGKVLDKIDTTIYRIVYGKEDSTDSEGNKRGIMYKIKRTFDESIDGFMESMTQKIIDPIHEKLFSKDDRKLGIFTKLFGKAKKSAFGKKTKGGFYRDGFMSEFANQFVDTGRHIKGFFTGKRQHLSDGTSLGATKDSVFGEMKGIFGNITGMFKEGLFGKDGLLKSKGEKDKGFFAGITDSVGTMLFGEEEKDKFGKGLKDFKKFLPKGIAGGLMGALGSFVLPGGLVTGTILGSTLSFVSHSDKAKDFIFGNEELGTKGFIPRPVQDFFKKHGKTMAAGGLLGGAASMFLPGGFLLNAMLGSTASWMSKSDKFKEFLFGKEADAENGIDAVEGAFPPELQAWFKKHGKGITKGAGLGMLSSFFLPGGPIMGAFLGSITGFVTKTDKFQEMIFGKEGEDGKKKGGLMGYMNDKLINPFKKWADKTKGKIHVWFDDVISKPFKEGMKPMKEAFGIIGEGIKKQFEKSGDFLSGIFEKHVGKPIGETIDEHLLKPIKNAMSKVSGFIGKIIGSILSSPIKLINAISKSVVDRKKRQEAGPMLAAELFSQFGGIFKEHTKEGTVLGGVKAFWSKEAKEKRKEEKEKKRRKREWDKNNKKLAKAIKKNQGKFNEKFGYQGDGDDGNFWTRMVGKVKGGEKYNALKGYMNTFGANAGSFGGGPTGFLGAMMGLNAVDFMGGTIKTPKVPKTPKIKDMTAEGYKADKEKTEKEAKEKKEKTEKEAKSKKEKSEGPTGLKPRKFGRVFTKMGKNLQDIRDAVHNQLNGVGWNLQYLTNLMTDIYGKPSKVPKDASKKENKKHRGFLGRVKDKVFGKIKGFGEGITSMFQIPKMKLQSFFGPAWKFVKGAAETIATPFKVLGNVAKFGGILAKELAKIGGQIFTELGKNLITVVGTGLRVGIETIGEVVSGGLKIINTGLSVLKESVSAIATVAKEGIVATAGLVKDGLLSLGSLVYGGARAVGNFIGSRFKKTSERVKKENERHRAKPVRILGGTIDEVKKVTEIKKIVEIDTIKDVNNLHDVKQLASPLTIGTVKNVERVESLKNSPRNKSTEEIGPTRKNAENKFGTIGRSFHDAKDDLQEDFRTSANNIAGLLVGVDTEADYRKAHLHLLQSIATSNLKAAKGGGLGSGKGDGNNDEDDKSFLEKALEMLGAGAATKAGLSILGKFAPWLLAGAGMKKAYEEGDVVQMAEIGVRSPVSPVNQGLNNIIGRLFKKGGLKEIREEISEKGFTNFFMDNILERNPKSWTARLYNKIMGREVAEEGTEQATKGFFGRILDKVTGKAAKEAGEEATEAGSKGFLNRIVAGFKEAAAKKGSTEVAEEATEQVVKNVFEEAAEASGKTFYSDYMERMTKNIFEESTTEFPFMKSYFDASHAEKFFTPVIESTKSLNAVEAIAKESLGTVDNVAASMADDAAKLARAGISETMAKEATEGIAETTMRDKIKKVLSEGIENLFNSEKITKLFKKKAIGKQVGKKIGKEVAEGALKKATKKAVGKIFGFLVGGPVGLAFIVADFLWGFLNPDEILMYSSNAKLDKMVNLCAGIANAISGMLFGLVPVDSFTDLLITFLGDDELRKDLNEAITGFRVKYGEFKDIYQPMVERDITIDNFKYVDDAQNYYQDITQMQDDYNAMISEMSPTQQALLTMPSPGMGGMGMTMDPNMSFGLLKGFDDLLWGKTQEEKNLNRLKWDQGWDKFWGKNLTVKERAENAARAFKGSQNSYYGRTHGKATDSATREAALSTLRRILNEEETGLLDSEKEEYITTFLNLTLPKGGKTVYAHKRDTTGTYVPAYDNSQYYDMSYWGNGVKNVDYVSQSWGKGIMNYVSQDSGGRASYGDSTIAESGCAPAVATMAINSIGKKKISLSEAAKWAVDNGFKKPGDGTTSDYFDHIGQAYGANFDPINAKDPDQLYGNLAKGNPVVLMGKRLPIPFGGKLASAYPKGMHYLLATGVDENGRIKIMDPGRRSNNTKTFNVNRLMAETKLGMVATPGSIAEMNTYVTNNANQTASTTGNAPEGVELPPEEKSFLDLGSLLSRVQSELMFMLGLGPDPDIDPGTVPDSSTSTADMTPFQGEYFTGQTNVHPWFARRIEAMGRAEGKNINSISGWRTYSTQKRLYDNKYAEFKKKYPNKTPEELRKLTHKWAAYPGTSKHEIGLSMDTNSPWLKQASNKTLLKYGLFKPMSYENWHIEPIETYDASGRRISYNDLLNKYGTPAEPKAGEIRYDGTQESYAGVDSKFGHLTYGAGISYKNTKNKLVEARKRMNANANQEKKWGDGVGPVITKTVAKATDAVVAAKRNISSLGEGGMNGVALEILTEIRDILLGISNSNEFIANAIGSIGGSSPTAILAGAAPGAGYGQNGFSANKGTKKVDTKSISKGTPY